MTTPPPPSETKLSEAIDALERIIEEDGWGQFDSLEDWTAAHKAARSSLESLYREQIAEIEAANQDLETLQDQIASKWDEGFRDGQDMMEAELSALRSLQLTPEEAQHMRGENAHSTTFNAKTCPLCISIDEKLRRISSKATSEEL